MAFTETWLHSETLSGEVEPTGFAAYRMDRDPIITGNHAAVECVFSWRKNLVAVAQYSGMGGTSAPLKTTLSLRPVCLPRFSPWCTFIVKETPPKHQRKFINSHKILNPSLQMHPNFSWVVLRTDYWEKKVYALIINMWTVTPGKIRLAPLKVPAPLLPLLPWEHQTTVWFTSTGGSVCRGVWTVPHGRFLNVQI